jgi:hypothetical protein
MPEYLEDGSVIFSLQEIQQLHLYTDKVEILRSQFKTLKGQYALLKGMHTYCLLCRDGFEQDTIKLKKEVKRLEEQIMADQYSRFRRVLVEEDQLHTML